MASRSRPEDRSYAELVAEGRALIPRLAPGWTDHNASDPGITLIELLAWLSELDLYRLGRTSEAGIRAFLRWFDGTPRPPAVAETIVLLAPTDDAPVPLAGELRITDQSGETVFTTTEGNPDDPLQVAPARLVRVQSSEELKLVDRTAANAAAAAYMPFGAQPKTDSALYLSFDKPIAGQVSLYLWTATPAADRITRRRLIAEAQAVYDEAVRYAPAGVSATMPEWQLHYSARTVWEYQDASGAWQPLAGVSDETRGLTLCGFVRFCGPAALEEGKPVGKPLQIRCRLVSGGYECPPIMTRIELNAFLARHAADTEIETLRSSGRAAQTFNLRHTPVVADSVSVTTIAEGNTFATWREAPDWSRVGPHDQVFVLAPEQGTITFGDGRIGRVPPAAAAIKVRYQVGGGPAGNLPAGTLTRVEGSDLQVRQPYPSAGSAPAETLDDARARVVALLAEQQRAITLDDYEELAWATPGVPVATAHAIADHHPAFPCYAAPGCVTVVIVPEGSGARPEPGPDMLAAVTRYLCRRRNLTAEIHVVGPRYTLVAVQARLHTAAGADQSALRDLACLELDTFLHPLRGGPERRGWPAGRAVYRAEVLALLQGLPGVLAVDQCRLLVGEESEPCCLNVSLCAGGLVAAGTHVITIIERSATL